MKLAILYAGQGRDVYKRQKQNSTLNALCSVSGCCFYRELTAYLLWMYSSMASVQPQQCSTPSSFRLVSPARTVWVCLLYTSRCV